MDQKLVHNTVLVMTSAIAGLSTGTWIDLLFLFGAEILDYVEEWNLIPILVTSATTIALIMFMLTKGITGRIQFYVTVCLALFWTVLFVIHLFREKYTRIEPLIQSILYMSGLDIAILCHLSVGSHKPLKNIILYITPNFLN